MKLPAYILAMFRRQGARGGKLGGAIGGKATTDAKITAARLNGAKGGRPPKIRSSAHGARKRCGLSR